MKYALWVNLIFWIVVFELGAQSNFKITMEANPNPATMNSQIVFSIEVSGTSRDLPDIPSPDLSGFRILAGPSTSTSINIINFKTQVSKTLTYYLFPKKTGKIKIAPIRLSYKKRNYVSNELMINIKEGSSQSVDNVDEQKDVFIKSEISSNTSFPYQQLVVSYKLYVRGRAESANIIEAPDYAGFWTEEFPKSNRPYQEMVGNKRYTVYDLEKKAIFPLKLGELTIKPYKLQVILIKKTRSSRNDPFDMFGDMGFFNRPKEEKILISDELKINVQPLPQGPVNFQEALVGNYELKINNTKFNGRVNDAITLKLTLNGNGYLKSIKELPLKAPSEFEVYDPKINESYSYSGDALYGSKSFEYIIIPRREGNFSIPENKIVYFDNVKKQYLNLVIPKIVFTIEKSSKKIYTNVMNENVGIELDKDIRFIKEGYDRFYMKTSPFYLHKLYWFLWIALAVLWGIFLKYKQYYQKITSDTSFYRQRKAVKIARNRLKKAIQAKDQEKFDIFLEEIFKAVSGFIADKLNKSAQGLTIKEIEILLKEREFDQEKAKEIVTLLSNVEYYRFSSVQNKQETMSELIDNTTQLFIKLQKLL